VRFKAFASGSNGNCIFIDNKNTHILIDMGISCKRICALLDEMEVKPCEVNGIFITHEHSDHTQGLFIFSKHFNVPIYATQETIQAILISDKTNCIDASLVHPIEPGEVVQIGDFSVSTIHTSHDAANSLAYKVEDMTTGDKVAVMTDLGCYNEETVAFLQGLNGLLLESNHDVHMLEVGSYPYVLKRRILGPSGHLSNDCCAELLCKIINPNLKFVLLGHLSEENNYPDIALMTVRNTILDFLSAELPFVLDVATRYESSKTYFL